MWAVAILALARTRRLAIVASGTRKARAMAATSSRARARSAKATWTSRPRAGWQQVKTKRSMSSRSALSDSMASITSSMWFATVWVPHRNAAVSLVDRADSRRSMSSALRRATTVSHARGLSGIPALGHASMAAIVASERASSATVKSPSCRANMASTLGPSAFSTSTRASSVALKGRLRGVGDGSDRPKLDLPPPPSGWDLCCPGDRFVEIGRLLHVVPTGGFFGFVVGPVDHHDLASLAARDGDRGRHRHRVESLAAAHDPGAGGPPGELRVLVGEPALRGFVPVLVSVVIQQRKIHRHRR